jgi:hypothetical protein
MQKTVKIDDLEISMQAFITAMAGLVLGVAMSTLVNVWSGFLIVAVFFVAAYNVNCAVVGKCINWSWILVAVYVLYAIAMVAFIVSGGSKGKGKMLRMMRKK